MTFEQWYQYRFNHAFGGVSDEDCDLALCWSIATQQASDDRRTVISNLQQQNTELLEDIAALRQEREVLISQLTGGVVCPPGEWTKVRVGSVICDAGEIVALRQERDALKAGTMSRITEVVHLRKERDSLQKNLDDTFGNMLEAREERDALKAEVQAFRDKYLTDGGG